MRPSRATDRRKIIQRRGLCGVRTLFSPVEARRSRSPPPRAEAAGTKQHSLTSAANGAAARLRRARGRRACLRLLQPDANTAADAAPGRPPAVLRLDRRRAAPARGGGRPTRAAAGRGGAEGAARGQVHRARGEARRGPPGFFRAASAAARRDGERPRDRPREGDRRQTSGGLRRVFTAARARRRPRAFSRCALAGRRTRTALQKIQGDAPPARWPRGGFLRRIAGPGTRSVL